MRKCWKSVLAFRLTQKSKTANVVHACAKSRQASPPRDRALPLNANPGAPTPRARKLEVVP